MDHCPSHMLRSELRVGKHFKVGPKIATGTFGSIYSGTNVLNNEDVAIKLEDLGTRYPQLHIESKLYRVLNGGGNQQLYFDIPQQL